LTRIRREAMAVALGLAVALLVLTVLAVCAHRPRPQVAPREHPTPVATLSLYPTRRPVLLTPNACSGKG
jgi:hypothetical protein